MTNFTLVLSGHLRSQQSADLRSFWSSFIELQKKLPAGKKVCQIVAHSWSPELAPLVSLVYAPLAQRHECKDSSYSEVISQFDLLTLFGHNINLKTSTWENRSIQLVLSHACSRSRAVELLDELPLSQGQVLITSWDLGQNVSEDVEQIILDASLPEDYIYLSYLADIDEGYADGWMLVPWVDARRFEYFYSFVIDSLTGRNPYIKLFSQIGWPRARVKTRFETWWQSPAGREIHLLASRLVRALLGWAEGGTLLQKLVRRLTGHLQNFLSQPPITAENSYVPGLKVQQPTFPKSQAINIRPLLKYFILSRGMRDSVRFLSREDFNIAAQSGQLINPQPIVLLVNEVEDSAMFRLLAESPLPLAAVYLMGAGSVRQHVSDGQGGWRITKLHAAGIAPRDLIVCALEAEQNRNKELQPVMIIPTVDKYLGCGDWFYMNALVKYLAWNRVGCVDLENSAAEKPYLDFPGLSYAPEEHTFSLRMAVGNLAVIRGLLNLADPELLKINNRAQSMKSDSHLILNCSELF